MVIIRFSCTFLVYLISFSFVGISCNEYSNETSTNSLKTLRKSSLQNKKLGYPPYDGDFSKFYGTFSSAVYKGNWEYIAELTTFPFVLKGEIDRETQVIFDKKSFLEAIDDLFKEEVYININDELLTTNYREVVLDLKEHIYVNGEEAHLFGLLFYLKNDGWKFSEISTHIHIVETYKEKEK